MIKPAGFNPAKKYPVYLSTYGGPHSQHVARRWGNYFDQYMAQQGFIVWRLDNRGSSAAASAPSPTPTTINLGRWKWKTS
jgi:dipeptidyl-peptidase-4